MMRGTFESLVERRFQAWKVDHEKSDARERPIVISVSREHGSGGALLGTLLSRRLGYAFFDKQLVEEIAVHAGVRQRVIETLDERAQGGVERFLASAFGDGGFTDSEYLRSLVSVLRVIGAHGRAVVVGRGAHFALEPASTLRLRVIAPESVRAGRIARRDGLSQEAALEDVRVMDRRWREYVREHFGADVDDPAHYDVVINTARHGIPATIDLALAAFRARFGELPQMPLDITTSLEEDAPLRDERVPG